MTRQSHRDRQVAAQRDGRRAHAGEPAVLESNATQMRHFLPTLITGLLQVPEYMRAAMNTPVEPVDCDTDQAVALKLRRQSILGDENRSFEFLMTESALRWQLCAPSVMAVQMDRLIELSSQPNIRIGVLSLAGRVADGAYHTFVTYDRRMVTVELFTGQLVLRDPKDVDHYRNLFDFFGRHALWGDDARGLLSRLAEEFRRGR